MNGNSFLASLVPLMPGMHALKLTRTRVTPDGVAAVMRPSGGAPHWRLHTLQVQDCPSWDTEHGEALLSALRCMGQQQP
jgi:hypothetical protein